MNGPVQAQLIITGIVLAAAAIGFAIGKIRSDLIAISALILMVVFGILDSGEALSGFSSSIVIMMIGLFVVGGGIFQTGLAKMASDKMLKLAGTNETRLLIAILLVTSFIGAFVSNTGTVAVMLPIVVSLAKGAGINPGRLLMPLAFASSIGGTLTLIGTPPNLVIRETLMNAGYAELSFFSYTPIGLVAVVIGSGLIILLSKLFLPKGSDSTIRKGKGRRRSVSELAEQYQISQNLFRLRVNSDALIIGQKLHTLNIPKYYHVHILEVRRRTSHKNPFFKTIDQQLASAETMLQAQDIIYVYGDFQHVTSFANDFQLELLDQQVAEVSLNGGVNLTGAVQADTAQADTALSSASAKAIGAKPSAGPSALFESSQFGIAEVLLTPNSSLQGRLIKNIGFRENYNINVLSIQRSDKYIFHELKEEKLRFGDALLVQGDWTSIARLAEEEDDVVVVGQPAEAAASTPLSHKAPIAGLIMLAMVVLLIVEILPAVVTVMLAAVAMVATGCLRSMETAYKTINWESVVLIGAMIPMSIAVEKTGAATLLSTKLVAMLGDFGPFALLAGIYLTTSFLTLFISNTACAVLLAPIALSAAVQLGVSPVPFMFAVSLAAGMCFAVPFSTPPNALVMSAGRYSFMDYVKVGLPLQLLLGIALIFLIPLFFPF